jgi:hypothetical protein
MLKLHNYAYYCMLKLIIFYGSIIGIKNLGSTIRVFNNEYFVVKTIISEK